MSASKNPTDRLAQSFLAFLEQHHGDVVTAVDLKHFSFVARRPAIASKRPQRPETIGVKVPPSELASDFERVLVLVRQNEYYASFSNEEAVWDFLQQMLDEALYGAPAAANTLTYRYNDFVPLTDGLAVE